MSGSEGRKRMVREDGKEADIDRLPLDLLVHIFAFMTSFRDLAQASGVCRKWRQGVDRSLSSKEKLSFAGWNMDDKSTSRIVGLANNLKELDISRNCWGCQITDDGLYKLSLAKCICNLTSISMWGMTGITDKGVILLVSRASSLQHINIGGTFITDESLYAIADRCPELKAIILWSCRHVTGNGLVALVNKCHKLDSINVWGMRIPVEYIVRLLSISPSLEIKPAAFLLNAQKLALWPVL